MIYLNNGDYRGDAARVLTFIAQFYDGVGQRSIDVDADQLFSLLRGMYADFPYPGGEDGASAFKKVANFVVYFTAGNPVRTALPPEILGDLPTSVTPIARSNAVLALLIAIASLHGATIKWESGAEHTLVKKIELSRHSFVDIADALTNATPVTSFKLVAVLFEQMAYKTNPDCQYPVTDLSVVSL